MTVELTDDYIRNIIKLSQSSFRRTNLKKIFYNIHKRFHNQLAPIFNRR